MGRGYRFGAWLALSGLLAGCASVVSYRPTAIGRPIPFDTGGVSNVHGPGLPARFTVGEIDYEAKVQSGAALTLALVIRNNSDRTWVFDATRVYRVLDDGEWVAPNDVLRRTVGRSLGARPEPANLEPGSSTEWTFLYDAPLFAPDQLTFLVQGLRDGNEEQPVLILVSEI